MTLAWCCLHRTEEEFVLLYEAYRPSNLPFLHPAYERFSLANKDPAECKAEFRVEKRDIPLLFDALRVKEASWSYVQNITELKEGIKTHKV